MTAWLRSPESVPQAAEDKIRIVLEGLRGENSTTGLRRGEGIAQSMYYGWSKESLQAVRMLSPLAGTEMFVIVPCL